MTLLLFDLEMFPSNLLTHGLFKIYTTQASCSFLFTTVGHHAGYGNMDDNNEEKEMEKEVRQRNCVANLENWLDKGFLKNYHDCTFVIGKEQQQFHGIKALFAIQSDVFQLRIYFDSSFQLQYMFTVPIYYT